MSTTTKLNDTKGATFHTETILSSLSSTLCEGVCFEARIQKQNNFVFLNQYIFNCTRQCLYFYPFSFGMENKPDILKKQYVLHSFYSGYKSEVASGKLVL